MQRVVTKKTTVTIEVTRAELMRMLEANYPEAGCVPDNGVSLSLFNQDRDGEPGASDVVATVEWEWTEGAK